MKLLILEQYLMVILKYGTCHRDVITNYSSYLQWLWLSTAVITNFFIHNTSHDEYIAMSALLVLGIPRLSPFLWWMLRYVKFLSIMWRCAMDARYHQAADLSDLLKELLSSATGF